MAFEAAVRQDKIVPMKKYNVAERCNQTRVSIESPRLIRAFLDNKMPDLINITKTSSRNNFG